MEEVDIFEKATFGYSLDYFTGGKFVGSTTITLDEGRDRVTGYLGRERKVLTEDIVLNNRKLLKSGVEVVIETVPLQGRLEV